jgi:competence protein ComEA
VGPVLAGRIIAHRETIGRFESVEDLLDVAGIGETRLASIRDMIRPP